MKDHNNEPFKNCLDISYNNKRKEKSPYDLNQTLTTNKDNSLLCLVRNRKY